MHWERGYKALLYDMTDTEVVALALDYTEGKAFDFVMSILEENRNISWAELLAELRSMSAQRRRWGRWLELRKRKRVVMSDIKMWTEAASPESVQFLLTDYFNESLRTSQVWEDVTRKVPGTLQQAFEGASASESILARFRSLAIRGELIRTDWVVASMLWMRGNEKPNCL